MRPGQRCVVTYVSYWNMFQSKKNKDEVVNMDEGSQHILSIIKDTSKPKAGIFKVYSAHTNCTVSAHKGIHSAGVEEQFNDKIM